jgi:hypothetical protein
MTMKRSKKNTRRRRDIGKIAPADRKGSRPKFEATGVNFAALEQDGQVVPKRKAKYSNDRVRHEDGHVFDSKREARRYGVLLLLQKAGEIRDLEVHPQYPLSVNGCPVCVYIADFRYVEVRTGAVVVEDAKGVRTAAYVIKTKLLYAVLGIAVREV